MMSLFKTIKEYRDDIKKRYPLGVPWVTPYEAFCQHHYNFDVIAQDYGLKEVIAMNTRHLEKKHTSHTIQKPTNKPIEYY